MNEMRLAPRGGVFTRTRFSTAPCQTCNMDTTHYVGKCIYCKTVNVRMPAPAPKGFLFGRDAA